MQQRILTLNQHTFRGTSVVYVMSRDQRVRDNHALVAAQQVALEQGVPLTVLFVLKPVLNRSREHYQFMLDGLWQVRDSLHTYGVPFVMRASHDPQAAITEYIAETDAGAVFFDCNPLRFARQLVKAVAADAAVPVYVVDTHNIVPIWVASPKQEFAAHTIRSKIHKVLSTYCTEPEQVQHHPHQLSAAPTGIDAAEALDWIAEIPASGIQIAATAGEDAALSAVQHFLRRLPDYARGRNDIAHDQQSGLSPYLHFGQIAALRVALEVLAGADKPPLLFERAKMAESGDKPSYWDGMNALFEEMIIRKELADNYCFYNKDYDTLQGAPAWAVASLTAHAQDARDFVYTRAQWEAAATHDEAWNAAQNQLRRTGKIHGYMRMYWAKKMLEWSADPAQAIADCIYLNDKYSIDGGDPNGYVGVLWSIAGLHDRPWFDRPVYGKIRYMNANGIARKFDLTAYIHQWS